VREVTSVLLFLDLQWVFWLKNIFSVRDGHLPLFKFLRMLSAVSQHHLRLTLSVLKAYCILPSNSLPDVTLAILLCARKRDIV